MADNFIAALLGQLKAPETPANTTFLNAWQRAEGTQAGFNPLATTLPLPGATSFNSAGVRNYPNFPTGLRATAQTLLNGRYDPIVSGLRSGTATAVQLAQAVADSPWGTGRGVLNVLGAPGVPTPTPKASALPSTVMPPSTSSVPSAQAPPDFSGALLSTLGQGPGAQLNAILGSILSQPLPSSSPLPSLGGTGLPSTGLPPTIGKGGFKPGDPVPIKLLSSIGAEHETAGLPGFPAHDYMARAGTPVVAPVGGTIVRFSGHDPRSGPVDGVHGPFGWSMYLKGTDGRTYYLTHLGSRDVQVGQKVGAGSVLGTIGDYAKWGGADHVHMGVSG
jgi:murein DD-endopeptidase MepM/ murein hydrolase activator NlpD